MKMKWTKGYLAVLVGISYLLSLITIVSHLFFGYQYGLGGIIALGAFTIFFSIVFVLND
ncbi:MAG: hypothetical protein Q8P32_00515 [Candidatus Komeilibacteria bacterium]|nr:hypothetical protein [Candidatus Komeilibacteria bacterium]